MQRQIKCKKAKKANAKGKENYSGCEQHFVLPIWLFCACVLINLQLSIAYNSRLYA